MKNSIMKKTWGILLGFGVSLATAAFVLTGCDWDVVEEDDITVTLSDGTAGDAKVLLTLTGTTWKADVNGVGAWVDWKLTGTNSSYVGITNPAAVRNSDTEVEITFSSSQTFSGTVEIEKLYPSMFKTFTAASLTSASVDFVSTPVTLSIGAAASTVTLSDGTSGDNKVTLTLGGATWNAVNTWANIGELWLFNPVDDTPTTVTGTRVSNTVAEFAFTGRAYTGAVQIDTDPTYFAKLKALTNIGTGSMAAVSDWVDIVVTTASQPAPTEPTTAQDLADALNATAVGGTGTATVSGTTVTLAKSVSLTAANSPITVPANVTLTLPGGGKTITLNGGTLKVNGTLTAVGGDLLVGTNSSGTITGSGTIQKSSANTYILVNVGSGQTLTVEGVTLKGIASNQASLVAVSGTLTLDGAKVTGNTDCTATTGGAGIRIVAGGTVTLKGGAEVYGNSLTQANGGGVYLAGTSGSTAGGILNIENGKVYGSVTMGATFETAVEDAKDRTTEIVANQNTVPQAKYGDAIYWQTGATVKVTGSSRQLTVADDEDYVTADSSIGFYTDVSIHATAAQFWNKAAR